MSGSARLTRFHVPFTLRVQEASLYILGAVYLVLSLAGVAPSEYGAVGAVSMVVGLLCRVETLKPLSRYLRAAASSIYLISFLLLAYASLSIHGLGLQGLTLTAVFTLLLLYAAILLYSSMRT